MYAGARAPLSETCERGVDVCSDSMLYVMTLCMQVLVCRCQRHVNVALMSAMTRMLSVMTPASVSVGQDIGLKMTLAVRTYAICILHICSERSLRK